MMYIFVVVENGKFCKKAFSSLDAALIYIHSRYHQVIDDSEDYMRHRNETCVRYLYDESGVKIYIHQLYL